MRGFEVWCHFDEAHVDQSLMSSYEQTRLPSACLEEYDKLKPDGEFPDSVVVNRYHCYSSSYPVLYLIRNHLPGQS